MSEEQAKPNAEELQELQDEQLQEVVGGTPNGDLLPGTIFSVAPVLGDSTPSDDLGAVPVTVRKGGLVG